MRDRAALEQDARRLRELAAETDDEDRRGRLLDAAAEAEGASLNGAGFSRPSAGGLGAGHPGQG